MEPKMILKEILDSVSVQPIYIISVIPRCFVWKIPPSIYRNPRQYWFQGNKIHKIHPYTRPFITFEWGHSRPNNILYEWIKRECQKKPGKQDCILWHLKMRTTEKCNDLVCKVITHPIFFTPRYNLYAIKEYMINCILHFHVVCVVFNTWTIL